MKTLIPFLLVTTPLLAQDRIPNRPVSTYSIVAFDPETGQIGAAVQSHWFSVGSIVTWARPGIGAVATQSFVRPSYGPQGLDMMATGASAAETLAALLALDADSQVRQVGMIDAGGSAAAHTGSSNIPRAGHLVGAGYAVQANMMENATVWPAMARAFENGEGDLADRMLAALQAAQAEGGDIRGMQSAALIVVSGDPNDDPWEKVFDLRVEDSTNPLGELERLLTVARAYREATAGDDFMTTGEVDSALAAYSRAAAYLPDEATNGELVYWQGITMLDLGRTEEAIPLLGRAFTQDRKWIELTRRLPTVGLLSVDRAIIDDVIRRANNDDPALPR